MTIHFIHCIDGTNRGDMVCGPYEYFTKIFSRYNCMLHHFGRILFDRIQKNDIVILGGGGLLDFKDEWNERVNIILNLCDNVISWGMGRNTHVGWKIPTPKINYKKFKLLGIRDWMPELPATNERFLPCVSCLMPWLSGKRKARRKWGVVEHWNFPITAFDDYKIDKIVNANSIETIRDFILTSEVIITILIILHIGRHWH